MKVECDSPHPAPSERNEVAYLIRELFPSSSESPATASRAELDSLREIRVTRRLQGGYGGADVFEIKLVFPGQELLQVLKVGQADEMREELEAYNGIFKDAQNACFVPIHRWTSGVLDPAERSPGRREALIYAHASAWIRSQTHLQPFEELAGAAVAEGGARLDGTMDVLRKLFAGVRPALHGVSNRPAHTVDFRDYWNIRLGPAATIATDGNAAGSGSKVHLGSAGAGHEPVHIFPDDVGAGDTWKNGAVATGNLVFIPDLTAAWEGDRLIGKYVQPHHPQFGVDVVPANSDALACMKRTVGDGTIFSLTGTLTSLRSDARRQKIKEELGLNFVDGCLTDGAAPASDDATPVADPFAYLPGLLEEPRHHLRLSRVHGDLNPRNILVVDGQPCLIDYRQSMPGQPLLADFCWLEVTLARRILPRDLAWQDHVLLQRCLSAACRIGEAAAPALAAILAETDPALANAYRLFAEIRLSSQVTYLRGEDSQWYSDYLSQLAIMSHITLKWASESPAETRAATAIAAVATESLWPHLTQKYWSPNDLQTLGAAILRLHQDDPASALFDLVATSHSLERLQIRPADPVFRAFTDLRSAYLRSDNALRGEASRIMSRVHEGHGTFVSLTAYIELRGRLSTVSVASDMPYDEFIQNDMLVDALDPDRDDLSGTSAIALLADAHRAVILGDAGAGKTTLVDEWQYLLTKSIVNGEGPTPRLPIVLPARRALDFLNSRAREDPFDVLQGSNQDLLRIGAAHLIVDGLNEISTDSRAIVATWLGALQRQAPLLPIAVCHRRYDYSPGLLPSFQILQLLRLTDEQAREYAQKYFATHGGADPGGMAERMLDQLTGNPELQSIRDLVENPMFLWMLVAQYQRDGCLRRSRGALFKDFTRWYLSGGAHGPDRYWAYPYERKAGLLGLLSYQLVERQQTALPESGIASLASDDFPDWADLLAEISESKMIFKERDSYRFLHQSFQEYFAASHFLEHYARDLDIVRKRIRRHNWWDTFVILLGFADGSSDIVLAIIRESLTIHPLLSARLLRVCEGIDAKVVEAFAREQESILSDADAPAHLHERSATALAEYGRGPAREAMFRLVRDVSLSEDVRRMVLAKLVEIATQPRFKSRREVLADRISECLSGIIQEESGTALRVLAIRSVATLKLPGLGVILSAIIDDAPRAIRMTVWEVCRELGIALPVQQVRNFQRLCVKMLAEADAELRRKHMTRDVDALNEERVRLLQALAAPDHLSILLQHRFCLGLADRVGGILDKALQSDGQPARDAQEAWRILRQQPRTAEEGISEWLTAFREADDLAAAAAAHRLCAVADRVPTDELERLLDEDASEERLAATAAILAASGNRRVAQALEAFLRRRLVVIQGYDAICSFALMALALVRLAGRRGHRLLALANSYLFDRDMIEGALQPLRVMHDAVVLRADDYEILLAGDQDSARAAIYNLQRASPDLLVCSTNRLPMRLSDRGKASFIEVVRGESSPRWQGFSARAICKCEVTELLPWLVEMAGNPELAQRRFDLYLPDTGHYAEVHRANVIRSIGYMARIAIDRSDGADADRARRFLRCLREDGKSETDQRIVDGIACALGFLGEWEPILEALRPGRPWMFRAVSNVFRYWIPMPPSGTRQRYEAALWIARRLKETPAPARDVASALLDVKAQIENSLGHVIDVDDAGEPLLTLSEVGAFDFRQACLNDNERRLREAIEADPRSARAYGDYALFLKNERKDFDGAEENYRKALELNPKQADIAANFAFFLSSVRHESEEARKYYDIALAKNPENAVWIGNYATFLENDLYDVDAARIRYEESLRLAPDDANLCANYAAFLIWQGEAPQAEHLLATAWRLRHDAGLRTVAKVTFLLALIAAVRDEDPTEALARLKSVLEGDFTTHPWPLTRLGEWMTTQLKEDRRALFAAIASALSDEGAVDALSEHDQWRRLRAISWKGPWARMNRPETRPPDSA